MKPAALLLVAGLVTLTGCQHPCRERTADLPAPLQGLPLLEDGGKVCDNNRTPEREEATIMYWGGKQRMNEVMVQMMAKMDQAGWAQYESKSEYAAPRDPAKPLVIFQKGDERVSVRFSVSDWPRLGSKLPADALTLNVAHYTSKGKERGK